MRYSAFISYNHRDKQAAMWLHRSLERFRFPKRIVGTVTPSGTVPAKLKPVFRDRDELAAAANLTAAVQEALEQSENLIVLCSPNGAKSQWVNEEIRSFRAMGKGDRIRCLVAFGEPHSGDPDTECLPPALFEDGNVEPLAADMRPEQDGKAGALLKLLASLVDLPYDQLRQREAARRHRRMVMITTATSLGLVFTTALTVFALISRKEAITQREIAERRTLTAERTVDFVKSMFKASDPSDARGETVTAGEILDRGTKAITQSLTEEPAVRAEMGITLAQVYGSLGAYKKAQNLAQWSFGIRHDDAETATRQWLVLASTQQLAGDYDAAIISYRTGIHRAEQSTDSRPQTRSDLYVGLGSALSETGQAGADTALQQALAIDQHRRPPAPAAVARDLEELGLHAIRAKDYVRAKQLVSQALTIRQKTEGAMSPSVSDDINSLGSIAYFLGDMKTAERNFRSRLAIDERVLGRDHPDIAITLNNIARVMIQRRDYAGAEPLTRRAVALSLREREETHDDFAFTFANLALSLIGQGKLREGEAYLERALRAARAHDSPNLGPVLAEQADAHCTLGEVARGLQQADEARRLMARDYPDTPWRTAWADSIKGACLWKAGKREQAMTLIKAADRTISLIWKPDTHYGALSRQRLAMVRP